MRIKVLGGCGAWPTAGAACSGFLVEHGGFRLLLDVGYATLPKLLESTPAEQVGAVVITHGHPDHCADLNPLLRARALSPNPPSALPVFALPGALDAVLALDRPGMLDKAYRLQEFVAGDRFEAGPFTIDTCLLPHWVPNAGLRVSTGDAVAAYTGDCGPDPNVVALAAEADLLIAEATYPELVPKQDAAYLTSARLAAAQAARAGAARLLLTHLWPGTDPATAAQAAEMEFPGEIGIAVGGLTLDL